MAAKKKTETFEEALARLDGLVGQLEEGKMSLADTVSSYEEGMKLAKALEEQLKEARQQLTVLKNGQEAPITEEQLG